jgi:hypothetical protein
MKDFGLKVSLPGIDANGVENAVSLKQLVIDTSYPFPKCDLRSRPKHYGTINFTVATIAASTTIILYQIPHSYTYIPSYLVAWNFPAGTDPNSSTNNATFGTGDIDMTFNTGLYVNMYTDINNFTISMTNPVPSSVTNITGTIRFYIFADDFNDPL